MKAITDTLIEYIKESGLKTGARLPSESAIASHLGVTRHQLRNGMELLKKQKVLIQRRGSGTYIKKGISTRKPKAKIITMFSPIDSTLVSIYEHFHANVFNMGYDLRIVKSSQTPEFEKAYMQNIMENRVAGLIVNPSPLYSDIFYDILKIREEGMKVALLSAPEEHWDDNAIFIPDYFKAGYQSSVRLFTLGHKKQIYLSSLKYMPHAWHYQRHLAGVRQASSEFNVDLQICDAQAKFDEEKQRLIWAEQDIPLDKNLGYICGNQNQAILLDTKLRESGELGAHIFAVSLRKYDYPFQYFYFDMLKQLKMALNYILDDNIPVKFNSRNVIDLELVESKYESLKMVNSK